MTGGLDALVGRRTRTSLPVTGQRKGKPIQGNNELPAHWPQDSCEALALNFSHKPFHYLWPEGQASTEPGVRLFARQDSRVVARDLDARRAELARVLAPPEVLTDSRSHADSMVAPEGLTR